MLKSEDISFTVDAGIINRLGLELVAKSETALAELIKNAYDADANVVSLYFENAWQEGGTLTIVDDGVGMNREQIIKGFMRLATTDKLHNSVSEKYKRPKAGRKGIGRFSTQRLGEKLRIQTQTSDENIGYELVIDWDNYVTDKEIREVKNKLQQVERLDDKESGTTLIIDELRERWSEADIKRVYRYVAELLQPNLLKVKGNKGVVEQDKNEGFEVQFFRRDEEKKDWDEVADAQIMMFDRALVTFTGYIGKNGDGHCSIDSKTFKINGEEQSLNDRIIVDGSPFELLKGSKIIFKVYYFIGGDRNLYYGITKPELKVILDYLNRNGGVKLYRNGFRVAKYGNVDNDWLSIENNARIGKGVPFKNNRLLGFVQLTDPEGEVFDEAAGREGLIEKKAFEQMQQFVSSALIQGFTNFSSWFRTTDEFKAANPDKKTSATSSSVKQIAEDLKDAAKTLSDPDAPEQDKVKATIALEQATKKFVNETNAAVNELEMMRVLAGTGLTIAEFVHEIQQIIPSLKGYISDLLKKELDNNLLDDLQNMEEVIDSLEAYTSYFDESLSKNVIRQLEPIDIRKVVGKFREITNSDLDRRKIELVFNAKGKDLITTPMHPSEWNTILQNLYSNAKKAINKSKVKKGQILIRAERSSDGKSLLLEFQDNGTGIPSKYKERVFDAFFTTYDPIKAAANDIGTGTGLGLYIIKQMVKNREGAISVSEPAQNYKTNIRIELPLATIDELKTHGY